MWHLVGHLFGSLPAKAGQALSTLLTILPTLQGLASPGLLCRGSVPKYSMDHASKILPFLFFLKSHCDKLPVPQPEAPSVK